MRITLKTHITGTRNGSEWPGYNQEVDLPEQEARDMVAAGMAVAIGEKAEVNVDERSEARKALSPTRALKTGK